VAERTPDREVRLIRVLLDTNVILDVLLNREPWVTDAASLWRLCSEGTIAGHISASSFTDIYYIARRQTDRTRAKTALRLCLDTFAVCPIDHHTLEMAYSLPGDDFEDNLQVACSLLNGFDFIITRDVQGFAAAPIATATPDEFMQQWQLPRTDESNG